jgi:hypothetical protein
MKGSIKMKYNKETFTEMIRDWRADNSPEYDELEIEEAEFDEDAQKWCAIAHDKEITHLLADDGRGNIVINYLGTL